MNEKQYRRTLDNKRPWQARGLDHGPGLSGVLQAAAARARRVEAAMEAWEKIARPEWRRLAKIDGFEDGVLDIAVSSSTARYELTRAATGLERELCRMVPGVRRVRFVLTGETMGSGPAAR